MPSLQRFAVDVLRVYLHRGFAMAQQVAHGTDVFQYEKTRQDKVAKVTKALAEESAVAHKETS